MRYPKPLVLAITFALVLQLFPAQAWAEVVGAEDPNQAVPEEQVVEAEAEDEAPGEEEPTTKTDDDADTPDVATEANAADTDGSDAALQLQGIVDEDDVNDDSDEETILTPYAETRYYESGLREGIYLSDKSTGLTYVVNVTEYSDDEGTGACEVTGIYREGEALEDGSVDLAIPTQIMGLDVTKLSFGRYNAFRSIAIPATVTEIAGDFGQSQHLESVTFAAGCQIATIPDAFFHESRIRSIQLPDTVTSIGPDAFNHCLRLTTVTFPDGLESIGNYAFYNAPLTSIDLPDGLVTIGDHAFGTGNRSSDNEGTGYSNENTDWADDDYLDRAAELTSISIPDSVTTIGDGAFNRREVNCDIFERLDEEGYDARNYSAENWTDSHIATLTLGRNLQTIGKEAFRGAPITTLTLPASLTSIGLDAFRGCQSLTTVSSGASQLVELNGFHSCTALTQFDLPDTLTAIGDYAFYDCANLQSADFPASLATIGKYAYTGCASLQVAGFPASLTTIGDYAFTDCANLQIASFPASLATIGDYAFQGCSSVEDLALGPAATWVGSFAFENAGLKHLTISEEGADLAFGVAAFRNCTGLDGSTLVFPERVVALAGDMFAGLTDVTYKFYNDALRIDEIDDTSGSITRPFGCTHFNWSYYEGDEGYDDTSFGEWMKSGTYYGPGHGPDAGSGYGYYPYHYLSVPNPWGGSQSAEERMPSAMDDSVVYIPDTLTKETSLSFGAFLKVYELEWARWEPWINYPESWDNQAFIWPEIKRLGEAPGPGPDPIEEPVPVTRIAITTDGPAGADANVCVFDSTGRLVFSQTANLGFTLVSNLAAGDYTVVAFGKNAYFKTVSSEDDFATMGLTTDDYARATVTVEEGHETEVTLSVSSINTPQTGELLQVGSVLVPKTQVIKGTEVFACASFTMAEGIQPAKVKVKIPEGLELRSVASDNKNYGTSGFDASSRTLTITLTGRDLTASPCRIWLGLKPTTIGRFSITASIETAAGATSPVGSAGFVTPGVTLETPKSAEEGKPMQVSVTAEPGSMVTIEAGGEPVQVGPTKANGTYVGTVTPQNPDPNSDIDFTKLTVRARIEDNGVTYEDASDVMLLLEGQRGQTLEATLWDFSFIHAGNKCVLMDEGRTRGGKVSPYYTYIANGDEKNKYWTFSATFTAPSEIADDAEATVMIQMADGTVLHHDMARIRSWQEGETWFTEYTYCAYIEQAGDHVFEDSLIPVAFDAAIDEHWGEDGPYAIRQQDVNDFKLLKGGSSGSWKETVERSATVTPAVDELFPTLSEEELQLIYNSDLEYVIYHRVEDEPWWGDLTEEQQQDFLELQENIQQLSEDVNQVLGFEKPADDYDNLSEWFDDNLGWEHDYEFDADNLESEGFDVYTDTDPVSPTSEGDEEIQPSSGTPHDWESFTQKMAEAGERMRGQASGGSGTGGGSAESPIPTSPSPITPPAQFAVRVGQDSQGHVKSLKFADRNRNMIDLPESILKYDPLASEFETLDIDMRTHLGDGVSKYLNIVKDRQSLIGSKWLGGAAKYLGFAADANTAYGLAKTDLAMYENNIRINELKQLIDDLQRQLDAYQKVPGHDYWCWVAISEQLLEARHLLIYMESENDLAQFSMRCTIISTVGEKISSKCKQPELTALFWGGGKVLNWAYHVSNTRNANEIKNYMIAYQKAALKRSEDCNEWDELQIRKNVKMDPSGIAYEVNRDHPLSGVTATVYEEGSTEAWDGSEYDEVNPQVTGTDGAFKWDVPMGSWYVRLAKDGYRDAVSDALPVPPPQLGVDLPMYTTVAPKVAGVSADTGCVEIVFDQFVDTDSVPDVTIGDQSAIEFEWLDCVEGSGLDADGNEYTGIFAKGLRATIPDSVSVANGDELAVIVNGVRNYAGIDMAEQDTRSVTVTPLPAKMVLNFEDTISMQAGTSRPATVRVYDKNDNPIEGLALTASLDNAYLAEVSAEGAVTDETGAAKVSVEALLPGLSLLTIGVEGSQLTRTLQLLTTVDTNQVERPTAVIGEQSIGAGDPKESYLVVDAGDALELACASEGATIYYTTDGSCPCQNTPGRQEYTGPIVLKHDTDFIVAAYQEGMDYSEKLKIHVAVRRSLGDADIKLSTTSYTYNGKAKRPAVTVTYDGVQLVNGTDYTVEYTNNVNAGTGKVTVIGKGRYVDSVTKSITIKKANQTITVSRTSLALTMGKTYNLKAKTSGNGKLTCATSAKSYVTVSSAGVLTPKNVTTKKVTITITAAATANYNKATKKVTVTRVAQGTQGIRVANTECVTGKTARLGAKTTGDGKLTYKSANPKIAKVNSNGTLTGVKAGTVKVTITAAKTKNFKAASRTVTVKVGKANTLTAKYKKATVTAKHSALKTKAVVLASNVAVSKPVGKVTYANASTNATAKKFKVEASTGKVTVPKGTKKGKYQVIITVRAAGNSSTISGTKTVKFYVQVG